MKLKLSFFLLFLCGQIFAADLQPVLSPDGAVKVVVQNNDQLTYTVYYKGQPIVSPSAIKLTVAQAASSSDKLMVKKASVKLHRATIISPVPEKRKTIPDVYRELTIQFK